MRTRVKIFSGMPPASLETAINNWFEKNEGNKSIVNIQMTPTPTDIRTNHCSAIIIYREKEEDNNG